LESAWSALASVLAALWSAASAARYLTTPSSDADTTYEEEGGE
jgi:hypothetical protein